MDREAWCAMVHGVTKSRTWLSNWIELNWNRNHKGNMNRFDYIKSLNFCMTNYTITKLKGKHNSITWEELFKICLTDTGSPTHQQGRDNQPKRKLGKIHEQKIHWTKTQVAKTPKKRCLDSLKVIEIIDWFKMLKMKCHFTMIRLSRIKNCGNKVLAKM